MSDLKLWPDDDPDAHLMPPPEWPGDVTMPSGPNRGKRLAMLDLEQLNTELRYYRRLVNALQSVSADKALGIASPSELHFPEALRDED